MSSAAAGKTRAKAGHAVLGLLDSQGVSKDALRRACGAVLQSRSRTIIACRHRGSTSECFYRGTKDGKKAPVLRRSHLEKALNLKNPTGATAHVRAYHLAWISGASDSDLERLKSNSSSVEVRHLCGHGECDNPEHLKLGTVDENENDKHYHFVLDKVADHAAVLAQLQQQIPGLDVV
jgi:hypothetical protein